MDTMTLANGAGLGLMVVGLLLRTVAVSQWQPVESIEPLAWGIGAALGALAAVVLALRKPTDIAWSAVGITAFFLVVGTAAMVTGLWITANGALDRSPGAEVPAVVDHPGQKLATVRITGGDAAGQTFQVAARLGTLREGQSLTARVHPGALGYRWCSGVR